MKLSDTLLQNTITIAIKAGKLILEYYEKKTNIVVSIKPDKSPLTQADLAAHQIITTELQQLMPDIPVLSEEDNNIPFEERKGWQRYWLIDPLDGTKEFLHCTDEFTVNIALIDKHTAILGVVYAPVFDICYFAMKNFDAYKLENNKKPKKICVSKLHDPMVITVSRSHGSPKMHAYLEKIKSYHLISKGSSLKSCLVAEGNADLYARFGKTSEWDTAAAQCIVEQAGGEIFDKEFKPLRYNTKASLINPEFFVVGDLTHNWRQYL